MKSLSPIFAALLAQAGERRVVRTNGQGSDDGSRQSERSLSATGSQGSSLQSNGGLTYTAESGLSQSRSTSLTNAATGNSLQGSTSYSRDGGLTRSVACQDASGASIACPSR